MLAFELWIILAPGCKIPAGAIIPMIADTTFICDFSFIALDVEPGVVHLPDLEPLCLFISFFF
jgi:hypothetical protein